MAFNSAAHFTDSEHEDEQARCEWLREVAGIPRPLRLLLNRQDLYGIPTLVRETIEQLDELRTLAESCRKLRSSNLDVTYRSVNELSIERLKLADALQMVDSPVSKELALCWRMAAGTSLTSDQLRQELGQQIVHLFGAYSSGNSIGYIGLGTACDLALAVASWSVVCHGGGIAIGGQTTGPWLLSQTRITCRLLRDAGEYHPGSHMHEINAGLQAEVDFLKDRLASIPVDNSYRKKIDLMSQDRQTASKRSRTLH